MATPYLATHRVGLIYDERMCKHTTPDGEDHPENPQRIKAIWNKLQSSGIVEKCEVLSGKEVDDKYVQLVHTKRHLNFVKNLSCKKVDVKRDRVAARLNSIYLNHGSSESAYLAAGSVIEVAEKVANGELNSAVAIVRPPGHHAEPDEAMGFCLYNNVAIATSYLLNERPELGIHKILIVDWDVHHGNGTQKMFWEDSRVLFFSVHRHDFGTFYPAGDDGSHTMIGEGLGKGYNINVPWEHGGCGDADYLAVWDHILIPIAKDFDPDMILISGGFDSAMGDPLGGCRVTPYGYSLMINKLMEFSNGKIVLALEGGYNLVSLANSVLACVDTLLEGKSIVGSINTYPFESTWRVIREVLHELSEHWPEVGDELLKKLSLTNHKTSPVEVVWSSDSDVQNDEVRNVSSECAETSEVNHVDLLQDILQPFSQLNIAGHAYDHVTNSDVTWRSVFSEVDIWYGSFGSNMWKSRFLCYIEGGMVEGMKKPCYGSMDLAPPLEVIWKTVPHRLFFGRSHTEMWGTGGVAFLHPERSPDSSYMCLYKITLEQFNDLLLQENRESEAVTSPLFDIAALDVAVGKGSILVEALKSGWYSNVVCLGKEGDLPILTMTCPLTDIESFRSGNFPMTPPAKEYMNTLVRGLVEGKQMSEEEAIAYITSNSAKPL